MASVVKTIDCPRCEQDISFVVEVYVDDNDLCCDTPDVVQCQMCGEDVDVYASIELNVEAIGNDSDC